MKSIAYVVTVPVHGGEAEIDTVFSTDPSSDSVRSSLINHDGYAGCIIVRKYDPREGAMLDWNGEKGKRFRGQ